MFFGGGLLIYSGFADTTPLAMIRRFLAPGTVNPDDNTVPYSSDYDPFYYGVSTGSPGFYQ